MEYAAGGDRFEHVVRTGGLTESEARWFFQQLLVGVDYVHRMVRHLNSLRRCTTYKSNICTSGSSTTLPQVSPVSHDTMCAGRRKQGYQT